MKNFITKNKKIFVFIFWILIWEVLYLFIKKTIIVPSPISVFTKLIEICKEKEFWISIFYSFSKTLIGFFGALILGSFLGFITYLSKPIKEILSPILLIIKTAPIVSFIMLTLFFINSNYIPIVISMLMVLPIVWENIYNGIDNVEEKYLQMAKSYEYTKNDIIKNIYIPKVLPYFISSAAIGIGFAWKSSITAELVSSIKYGIGNEIYLAKLYLETESIFAWTFVIIILSLIFQKIFREILNGFNKKYY